MKCCFGRDRGGPGKCKGKTRTDAPESGKIAFGRVGASTEVVTEKTRGKDRYSGDVNLGLRGGGESGPE